MTIVLVPLEDIDLSPPPEPRACDIICGPVCEWIFSRIIVWPLINGATQVEWTLHPQFGDPGPYDFRLQVGRTGNPLADDWEYVGCSVRDTYYAIDDTQRVYGKTQWTHYRLILTTVRGVYASQPQPAYGTLGLRMWHRARELQRKELLRFRAESGQEGYLLKRRLFGEACPCLDTMTGEVRDPQHELCYGTGFIGGYFAPYSCFYVDTSPNKLYNRLDGQRGTTDDLPRVRGRMLNTPQVFSGDVWVSKSTDYRWLVHRIDNLFEVQGVPIIVSATLHLLPFTHPVYKLPLEEQIAETALPVVPASTATAGTPPSTAPNTPAELPPPIVIPEPPPAVADGEDEEVLLPPPADDEEEIVDDSQPPPVSVPDTDFINVPQDCTLAQACVVVTTGGRIRIHGEVSVLQKARLGRENGAGPRNVTFEFMPGARLIDAINPLIRGALLTVNTPGCQLLGVDMEGIFAVRRRALLANRAADGMLITVREIKNFGFHALDVNGDNTIIRKADDGPGWIHHILWWDNGRRDAHAIVTLHSDGLLIEDLTIWNTSGDSFQADRGIGWNNVTVRNCDFYDTPLLVDIAGFSAGMRTAENAIDTKTTDPTAARPYRDMLLEGTRFHGFRGTIPVTAALNIKEGVRARIVDCDIYDSDVGLRASGRRFDTHRTKITMENSRIYDCDDAIRGEDKLEDFTLDANEFYNCIEYYRKATGTEPWTYKGWLITDNIIRDTGLIGSTFVVWSGDRVVLGTTPLSFPVPPLTYVAGTIPVPRNTSNLITTSP